MLSDWEDSGSGSSSGGHIETQLRSCDQGDFHDMPPLIEVYYVDTEILPAPSNEDPVSVATNDLLIHTRACSPKYYSEGATTNYSMFTRDWLRSRDDCAMGERTQSPFAFLTGASRDQNDSDSVQSTAYYDPSDLNPANWMKAMNVPTFGFAVVALGAAITHPVLFMAGALAAFGTASAAGAGYGYFLDWCGVKACEHDTSISDDNHMKVPGVAETIATGSSLSADGLVMDRVEGVDAAPERHLLAVEHDDLSDDWIDLHFPKLETFILGGEKFVGLSVVEFFRVFYDDHAPYNFREFQRKRGDHEIVYGEWRDLPRRGPVSIHPSASKDFPREVKPLLFRERVVTFKAKTNSFFGPTFASTTKVQRVLTLSKKLSIIESMTSLADIPFSDRFSVMERWVIKADKVDDCYSSYGSSWCEVFFTKPCPFEVQIRTKSAATVHDVAVGWCAMAQEALKLAEQAKIDRLRHSMSSFENGAQDDDDPENAEDGFHGIEVEHDFARFDYEQLSMRKSGSEPDLQRRQPLKSLRRSISQLSRRRASTDEGAKPRKLSTIW